MTRCNFVSVIPEHFLTEYFQIFNDHTTKHLTAERQKLNEKFQKFREWYQLIDEPLDSLSFDAFSWYGIQF